MNVVVSLRHNLAGILAVLAIRDILDQYLAAIPRLLRRIIEVKIKK